MKYISFSIILTILVFCFDIQAQESSIDKPLEWIDFEFKDHGIWQAKEGTHGPGPIHPNQWAKKNVIVDDNGNLCLKITNNEGQWYSSEVRTKEFAKYGTYIFDMVLSSPDHLDILDANITTGVFFYEGITEKEFDIEFAKWGYPNEIRNTECSIHSPYGSYSSLFHTGSAGPEPGAFEYKKLRASISWTPHQIIYKVYRATLDGGEETYWEFQGGWEYDVNNENYQAKFIPTEEDGMRVHFNFWLLNGLAPLNNSEAEIMITDYQFIPL